MLQYAWVIGAIYGMLAVALGALGAHALKDSLTEAQLASFETAVRYQFYHALALLAIYLAKGHFSQSSLQMAALLMALGVLCFSGSIYLLSCRELVGMTSYRWLGPITPIGGILMMSGWTVLLYAGIRSLR